MPEGDRRPLVQEFDERDSVSYEEFGGTQDYVNCPTCQGTGRVASSTSQQLVALIPYDDERLKPKKTAMYLTMGMTFGVAACGLIASLLVYFLLPRPVEVLMIGLNREGVKIDDTGAMHMNFTIPLQLKNPNFSTSNLTSIDGTVSFLNSQVGKIRDKDFHILSPRSYGMWQNMTTSITFDNTNHLEWMSKWCSEGSTKILSLSIHISANVTFRGSVQQTAIQQLCYVSCDPEKTDARSNCNYSPA